MLPKDITKSNYLSRLCMFLICHCSYPNELGVCHLDTSDWC